MSYSQTSHPSAAEAALARSGSYSSIAETNSTSARGTMHAHITSPSTPSSYISSAIISQSGITQYTKASGLTRTGFMAAYRRDQLYLIALNICARHAKMLAHPPPSSRVSREITPSRNQSNPPPVSSMLPNHHKTRVTKSCCCPNPSTDLLPPGESNSLPPS